MCTPVVVVSPFQVLANVHSSEKQSGEGERELMSGCRLSAVEDRERPFAQFIIRDSTPSPSSVIVTNERRALDEIVDAMASVSARTTCE
jgi:hypothetical protein